MANVFVSYSRADSNNVNRLIALLQEGGHHVWIDRAALRGGEIWRRQIVNAIRASDVMVLVLSPRSVESDNVRRELDLAETGKIPVIPVEIEPVTVPPGLLYQLVGIQQINLYTDYSEGVKELLNALGREQPPLQERNEISRDEGSNRRRYIGLAAVIGLFVVSAVVYAIVTSSPRPSLPPMTQAATATSEPELTAATTVQTVSVTLPTAPTLPPASTLPPNLTPEMPFQWRVEQGQAILEREEMYWEKYEADTDPPGLYLRSDNINAFGDYLELSVDGTYTQEENGNVVTGTWKIDGSTVTLTFP